MRTERIDFAEFYRAYRDDCLRTVLVIVGDQDTAQEVVAEAFARACASWRTVGRHPAPAAWVVTRQGNGDIKVTIRELRDPAGLQQRLRADGVPASVTFAGQQNPACHTPPRRRCSFTGLARAVSLDR